MRKQFLTYFLCALLFLNSSHLFAQYEATLSDTTEYATEELTTSETENEEVEIIKVDTSSFRKIDENKWEELKNDKAFIYKKEIPKTHKTPNIKLDWLANLLSSGVLKFILFTLVGVAVLFILYSLFNNSDFNYFKKRKKNENDENQTWENVTEFNDWEIALQKALAVPDYRLAVRVMYLETLQLLHLGELIHYEQEKTNWQYVAELGDTTFKKPFTLFTKYFDYVWYGNFEMTKETFEEIKNIHSQLKNSIQL